MSDDSPTPPLRVRIAVTTASIVGVAVLAVHMGFTVLYNAPLNPLSLVVAPATNSWMHPYFEQNWQLFAPLPLSSDNGVLVRAKLQTPDGVTTTEYVDVTSPAVEAAHARHPFHDRTSRQLTYAAFQLEVRDPIMDRLRDRNDIAAANLDGGVEQAHEDHRERGLAFIRSLASIEAERLWGDQVVEVQVRLVSHEFPRFSRRHETDAVGEIYFEELPWMPFREEPA